MNAPSAREYIYIFDINQQRTVGRYTKWNLVFNICFSNAKDAAPPTNATTRVEPRRTTTEGGAVMSSRLSPPLQPCSLHTFGDENICCRATAHFFKFYVGLFIYLIHLFTQINITIAIDFTSFKEFDLQMALQG